MVVVVTAVEDLVDIGAAAAVLPSSRFDPARGNRVQELDVAEIVVAAAAAVVVHRHPLLRSCSLAVEQMNQERGPAAALVGYQYKNCYCCCSSFEMIAAAAAAAVAALYYCYSRLSIIEVAAAAVVTIS